jgi:site-specific DNA-methyltransferase (adenine-specific)
VSFLKKTLTTKLVDFLASDPKHLKQIYTKFPDEKQTTIRGRLNENINRCFKRIQKGVYIATVGDAKALIIEGDAWNVIKDLKDESIDAIITDSPYTALNYLIGIYGTTRKRHQLRKWSFETRDIDEEMLKEMMRVLKPGGHFFSFMPSDSKYTYTCNQKFMDAAIKVGFEFNKKFIWDKITIGMGYHGRNRYEQIAFLSKGKRAKPYDMSIPDLISVKRIPPKQRLHEMEKPVELMEDLVKFCSKEGDVILDSFAGALPTAKACLNLKRNCICIEIARDIIDKAIKTMNGAVEAF